MGVLTALAKKSKKSHLSKPARRKSSIRQNANANFRCEALEPRLLMNCDMGPMSPAMMTEQMNVLNLVMPDMATHTAVQSGNWSDAATWQNGQIPTAGANVLVPEGVTVTFDVAATPSLHWLRDDGTIQFSTTTNTSLLVDTIVVTETGHWIMGTAADPIHQGVTSTVAFADQGAIDLTWDPLQFSRGFIALGSVDIHGQQTTAYEALSVNAHKGDTILNLAALPTNWKVGDSLILTGTNPLAHEDEKLTILAMQGNQITVSPLAFDHVAPAGQSVYVGDVTRNVVFQSQNQTDIMHRGHFMIMHSDAVDVEYAAFVGLGRTDKSKLIDDYVMVKKDGSTLPGGGTNVRGRYAFHVHHSGTCPDDMPLQVVGNVVLGSPGWGFVNHKSNVDFSNNVSYDTTGAGFVTEAGDEIGSFKGNLAIYAKGSTNTINRELFQDWGYRGHGFWFQSPNVTVQNNIAVEAAQSGFAYFPIPVVEAGMAKPVTLTQNLLDPTIANGATSIGIGQTPIRVFDGNVGYADNIGVEAYAHMMHSTLKGRSLLKNSTFWGISTAGLQLNYSAHIDVSNVRLIGNLAKPGIYGININSLAEDFVFDNVHIERFLVGVNTPTFGKTVIKNSYIANNTRGIDILNARDGSRFIDIQNVNFGPPSKQVNINVQVLYDGKGLRSFFTYQGVVRYNTQYLYAKEQAANYVPFPATKIWSTVPSILIGKTNQQLMDQFGLCAGGVLAPAGAVSLAGSRALAGAYVAPLPALTLVSPQTTSNYNNYQLVYTDTTGKKVYDSTLVQLQKGWNVITRTIGGRKRSFLVCAL